MQENHEKKSRIHALKEKSKHFEKEIRTQGVGYIVTALGLIAGLAWNEAIKSIITTFFPQEDATIVAKLGYAVIVTIVVVILGIYLTRLIKKD